MSSPFPASAAVPGLRCPYPGCANNIDAGTRGVCACDYKLPLTRCPACAMVNRAGARVCRACQKALPQDILTGRLTASPVDFVEAPGDYYFPPAVQQGLL